MKEKAKVKKNKEGYFLREKWNGKYMIVKAETQPLKILILDNNADIKDVCSICGDYERHAPFGPWVFAGRYDAPICEACIRKSLPDLLPELKEKRIKWNEENPDFAYEL